VMYAPNHHERGCAPRGSINNGPRVQHKVRGGSSIGSMRRLRSNDRSMARAPRIAWPFGRS
jgi:hypothetical protein